MSQQKHIHVLSRAAIIHQDHILLCQTLDLEHNFYFLPGGHVENGESAEAALIRELKEETGQDCQIQQFLGCLEYHFEPGYSSICHNHEYNFIFTATSDTLTSHQAISSPESHISLIWMPLTQLSDIDFRAEPLKRLLPQWLSGKSTSQFASQM